MGNKKEDIWSKLSAKGLKQKEDKRKFQSRTIEINLEYVNRDEIKRLFAYLRNNGWFADNDVRYVIKQTQIPLSFDNRSAKNILKGGNE